MNPLEMARVSIKSTIISFLLPFLFLSGIRADAKEGGNGESAASIPVATIRGIVKDDAGNPLKGATIGIFRLGTARLLKQVTSNDDGSFIARIAAGTYSILAVAEGYNPVSIASADLIAGSELVFGFKLERAGSGNTLPEKKLDRNNPKWVRRSVILSRSIYQNNEGSSPVNQTETAENTEPQTPPANKVRMAAETYFADGDFGPYLGTNIGAYLPLSENVDLIIAAQTGTGSARQAIETKATIRTGNDHKLRLGSAFQQIGNVNSSEISKIDLSVADEWQVREGLVLVYGVDLSKFVGLGGEFRISPRLGILYDLNPKTRLRGSYTTETQPQNWSRVLDLEDAQIAFREPVAIRDIVLENGRAKMPKLSRLEFGVERVLDNNSSLDFRGFFDTVYSRGIAFTPEADLGQASDLSDRFTSGGFTSSQNGNSQGLSLVYNRRLGSTFTASAGYSFGKGQRVSPNGLATGRQIFENGYFQTYFGSLDADFSTGTNVQAIFRFSPQAAVFAIDPFQNRVAVYDPGMSILVTQNLPTLGLPIHAQAVFDARNLLDRQNAYNTDEGTLRLYGAGRSLRGGIKVLF
ncbi:MAG TPA: TonB-dependent receptor [Pyrinomonadaceae bacterium]|nr:TonB-dependent receptor [Pyrinomonadaceae bacterium]